MFPSQFDRTTEFGLFDDFDKLSTGTGTGATWQAVKGTGGTLALEATGGSWLDIPTAATINDYQAIALQQPFLALIQNKHIYYEVRFKCTEAATNGSVLAFGLSSTVATGFMGNATAGPPASFTGAVFYKVSGGLALGFRSSVTTTNTDNAAFATLVSGTIYRLSIEIDLSDPTVAIVIPKINGVLSLPPSQTYQEKVQQRFAYGSGNLLYPFVSVKSATATTAETLSIDYIAVSQVR